ncbi:hypothetical protein KW784_01710 [Candidatus Parcubacteria bacterium]|nr:hypothetical protein [Candidatus Parcubacteria bacterium]
MDTYENRGFVKRNIIWLLVLAAAVIFGLLLFNGWDKVVNDSVDKITTTTGNFSCLPRKDNTPEENCTLGVRSRDGSYYALDISRIQDANTDLKAEDTIAVTGFLLPASAANDSKWADYNVAGVIKVNTLLRTR